jgi:signal transduction histidine kinase
MKKMLEIYNDLINLLMANSNNVVAIILVLSIGIVFVSILYVLLQAPQNPNIQSKRKRVGKTKKIKYTKEFLRRVEGLDLELKESPKN